MNSFSQSMRNRNQGNSCTPLLNQCLLPFLITGRQAFSRKNFNTSSGLGCLEGSDTRLPDTELRTQVLREDAIQPKRPRPPVLPLILSPTPTIYSGLKTQTEAKPKSSSFKNLSHPATGPGLLMHSSLLLSGLALASIWWAPPSSPLPQS